MSTYKFKQPTARPAFGALPEGDYNYTVSECGEPHVSTKSGLMVLAVKLSIQPEGIPVFANPWSGTDKNGTYRDGIAEFLISCDRAPRENEEPEWSEVIGARGKCRLKIEIAQMGALAGKEVNKVAWFIAPKQLGPQANQQRTSKSEFEKARVQQVKASGGATPDPDDIPF